MKLTDVCKIVEDTFPQTYCRVNSKYKQIICFFRNTEDDGGISLLTPWYQMRVKDDELPDSDVPEIIESLRRVVVLKNQIRADLLIKEINGMDWES